MASRVRTLNLKWKGLYFVGLLRPFPSYLAPSPLPGAPKRSIANDLSLTASVGGQAQGFGIRKTWLLGVPAVQRDSMLQTLTP